MVEAVPEKPYKMLFRGLQINECRNSLKSLIEWRLRMNNKLLEEGLSLLSIPNFPSLGKGNFLDSAWFNTIKEQNSPNLAELNVSSKSEYILEELANPHPWFPTLMRNIWERRGKKVDIWVPVFQDKNTSEQEIHMDSMHFGMGMCCL